MLLELCRSSFEFCTSLTAVFNWPWLRINSVLLIVDKPAEILNSALSHCT
jgi:hypothetical protein